MIIYGDSPYLCVFLNNQRVFVSHITDKHGPCFRNFSCQRQLGAVIGLLFYAEAWRGISRRWLFWRNGDWLDFFNVKNSTTNGIQ
jgi:hypothetical protein